MSEKPTLNIVLADSFDTHEYLNSLKELKSDMYERYYEEYRRVYQL